VAERVLTTRELNRALLARQILLERSSMPLTRAIEQVGGLQTQYSPSGYIALWSRLRDFRRDALTRALEKRRVVQGWMMRSTIHMASARDYWPFVEGVRRTRQDTWFRAWRKQVQDVDIKKVAKLVRSALRDGPRKQAELAALIKDAGYPSQGTWYGAQLYVDMVRVPPSGTWERPRADLYALAENWLGPSTSDEKAGQALLVRRFLGGFGPASVGDIAGWTGWSIGTTRQILEPLRLRRFRGEEGGELMDLARAPLPDADASAPPRFIPAWEPMLLVSSRRTQVLPEEYRGRIFNTKTPHSFSTFLLDGQVAGTWKYEKGKVRLEPFAPIPRKAKRELEDEAALLAAWHAD
jgi:hypothetical protein